MQISPISNPAATLPRVSMPASTMQAPLASRATFSASASALASNRSTSGRARPLTLSGDPVSGGWASVMTVSPTCATRHRALRQARPRIQRQAGGRARVHLEHADGVAVVHEIEAAPAAQAELGGEHAHGVADAVREVGRHVHRPDAAAVHIRTRAKGPHDELVDA